MIDKVLTRLLELEAKLTLLVADNRKLLAELREERGARQRQGEGFQELFAWILSQFSKHLLEKALYQAIQDEERRQKREQKSRRGGFRIGKFGEGK